MCILPSLYAKTNMYPLRYRTTRSWHICFCFNIRNIHFYSTKKQCAQENAIWKAWKNPTKRTQAPSASKHRMVHDLRRWNNCLRAMWSNCEWLRHFDNVHAIWSNCELQLENFSLSIVSCKHFSVVVCFMCFIYIYIYIYIYIRAETNQLCFFVCCFNLLFLNNRFSCNVVPLFFGIYC